MLLPILAAVLAFITIGGVGWVLVGGDDSSSQAVKRAKTMGGVRAEAAASAKRAAAANTPEARRKQILLQLQEVDRRERKARMTMGAKLKQAGLSLSVRTFVIISVAAGLVGALLAFVLGANIIIVLGVGVAAGLGLPRWIIGMKAKARMKNSLSPSPMRSTSWCAASRPACRSMTVSRSSPARAPSRWPASSASWSRAWGWG